MVLPTHNFLRSVDQTSRHVSLTTPPQTNAQGLAADLKGETEETFLKALDAEMAKVEAFTLKKVTQLRDKLRAIEGAIRESTDKIKTSNDPLAKDSLEKLSLQAEEIADDFLRLEKYVNLNFMGFHKILKKHDKHLPNNPCKAFYINRMHAQSWVRGDYSDLVVRLSHVYSSLRQDDAVAEPGDEANQSFLRSTTKYWVKTEDVSRVKYAILKHLPLFLQKTSTGDSDSQFTNSVYLDNDSLELYHGRLDKTPGAIALRLRWYGVGDPTVIFVERKTHNEKWTGEISVKERFMVSRSTFMCTTTQERWPLETSRLSYYSLYIISFRLTSQKSTKY